eukprot:399171-Hanusia_phi.AAC.2
MKRGPACGDLSGLGAGPAAGPAGALELHLCRWCCHRRCRHTPAAEGCCRTPELRQPVRIVSFAGQARESHEAC